ncbi:MAG: bifunctional glutamate N-acetyltransferase/amino-acid acetyltransferase ArgJ [Phycisphaeraceae bacterium]|nr:bifunctional glutamate N-acetyltransferase/amino-acid acetyltransferase ArgJ [Phycisphaeraceae bacterium]
MPEHTSAKARSASAAPSSSAVPASAEATTAESMAAAPQWPRGFAAATGSAAIKAPGRDDMALLVCERGATAAGVFTRNLVCAAPIRISRTHLSETRGHATALLLNSGNANAATGQRGLADAQECVDAVAAALEVDPSAVLVNSTGVIGVPLPLSRMVPVIGAMARKTASGSVEPMARAIMTTDTRPKWAEAAAGAARVVGIAKGAGMIHPDMATMIAVLVTDAAIDPLALDRALRAAVNHSFHRISIDGDTSTNDSVFALASGEAGPVDDALLTAAFTKVSQALALRIVSDGEGFERAIRVRVCGAGSSEAALQVARTIAQSLLVRTAVTGGDPNWGRILAAAGRAGVPFSPDEVRLEVGGVPLYCDGAPAPTPLAERERAFRETIVEILLDLGRGGPTEEFLSCGLTEAYVRLNSDYTT